MGQCKKKVLGKTVTFPCPNNVTKELWVHAGSIGDDEWQALLAFCG